MHRRARHLNPKHAGAVSALDTRFLSGLNDGDGIGTFTSRTGTNSPTQATAANKPLYKVNIQGGCPAALCDISASSLGRFVTYSGSPISGATAASVIYSYERTGINASGGGAPVLNFGNYFNEDHEPYSGTTAYTGFASTSRQTWTTVAQNVDTINSVISKASSFQVLIKGVSAYSTATNTVGIGGSPRIGANNYIRPDGTTDATAYYWIGYIHTVQVFNFELLAPLRKRLEHAIGFSFKIQTS